MSGVNGGNGRPRWMTAWRYFIADVIVPTTGAVSLVDMSVVRRDGFNPVVAGLAVAMAAGGPITITKIEGWLSRKRS